MRVWVWKTDMPPRQTRQEKKKVPDSRTTGLPQTEAASPRHGKTQSRRSRIIRN